MSNKQSFSVTASNDCVVDITRFSKYDKLINVTARVLRAASSRSILNLRQEPETKDIHDEEKYWIKLVQKGICKDWQVRYRRLGPSMNNEGIILVGSRISKWLKENWNRDEFILLLPGHPFTKLLIASLHYADHAGVESTLAKLQDKYWVPGARKIIKTIKSGCVECRKINKVCETQIMGSLPEERLSPAPPFYHTSLDLFGPFLVKDPVKRRTTMKVFGIIFTCMLCRGVYLDIAEGYDANSFLRVFRRFTSLRGFPKTVHSDRGSQLVKANKELTEMINNVNSSTVTNYGRNQGMTWIFTKAADAPWQNACAESLIRSVKRAITVSIGERILQFGELQTIFFEIGNLLNQRPIGIKPGYNIDLGSYLSPNDLLLGHKNTETPSGLYDVKDNILKNFKHANDVINSFWKRWMRDYFPTLIVRNKWHVEKRNVSIGDIVLVKDSNVVRGHWKLAQVLTANPGSDGKVRNVTLRFKSGQTGTKYHGQKDTHIVRSVHNIVVILPVEEQ